MGTSAIRLPRALLTAAAATLALAGAGCSQLGAQQLRNDHVAFNTAVAEAMDRQMLLNLVRIAHDEPTQWVSVTQITTSTQFSASASGDVSLPSLASGSARAGAGFSYTPTLNFVPRQGEQLAEEVMAPIPVVHLEHMTSAGWPMSWMLFLICERCNGLRSFDVSATRPTATVAPAFGRFLMLVDDLEKRDLVSLSAVASPVVWNIEPIPAGDVTLERILAAREKRAVYRAREDERGFDYTTLEELPVLTTYDGILDAPGGREFLELAGLAPRVGDFRILGIEDSLPGDYLTIRTRSLAAIMQLLSWGVASSLDDPRAVPGGTTSAKEIFEEIAGGAGPSDLGRLVRRAFRVHSGPSAPDRAQTSVLHRGTWYWIDADDTLSKQIFGVARDLFDLQVRTGADGPGLYMTLPVR